MTPGATGAVPIDAQRLTSVVADIFTACGIAVADAQEWIRGSLSRGSTLAMLLTRRLAEPSSAWLLAPKGDSVRPESIDCHLPCLPTQLAGRDRFGGDPRPGSELLPHAARSG